MVIWNDLPQFQTDYIISWDTGSGDATCVQIVKIRREGNKVVTEHLGQSFDAAGCFSLRQVIEWYEDRKRQEERKAKK